MAKNIEEKIDVSILFAGDSGDGIQLTGSQFTNTASLFGNDLSTFPNFPAEIRAPQGTTAGVSGFQIRFGSVEVHTPGDQCDVLVAMNAAGLKMHLPNLKKGGTIIANVDGFNAKNLKLAGYDENPLESKKLLDYKILPMQMTKMTQEVLKASSLGKKEIERSRNMFVLGFLYYMYNRDLESTKKFIRKKFAGVPEIMEANLKVLDAGYNFGDTSEIFTSRYNVQPAKLPFGKYRNIVGNQATALALVAASKKAGLDLFYGSYPITPASDILHELSKHKNFGVKTFQAEDEIAAICSVIGAAFGGKLAVTASSGPGIALKSEAVGLGVMLELPMVICNIQRGGPSTGLPTKTEQSDLMQVLYGRNGEAPLPVVAASSPSDCFDAAYTACKIAIEHMTPVFFLSDGYLANGSEPWKYPQSDELENIVPLLPSNVGHQKPYLPYVRNEDLVREWAIPGMRGLEHRLGGLEKEDRSGNVSYDPENHEKMVKTRAAKIEKIANKIDEQKISSGKESGKVVVLGWGSTFGIIKSAVQQCVEEGLEVGQVHLRYLNPLPKNLGELIAKFDQVLMPEMNNGQFVHIIRDKYLVDAKALNKIKGIPFTIAEIVSAIKELNHK